LYVISSMYTLAYPPETEISIFGYNLNSAHILFLICHALFPVLSRTQKKHVYKTCCVPNTTRS
jgi:hypothetical protein